MSETNALRFQVAEVEELPSGFVHRCHMNGLFTVQAVKDEGISGCRQMGAPEDEISLVDAIFNKKGFDGLV